MDTGAINDSDHTLTASADTPGAMISVEGITRRAARIFGSHLTASAQWAAQGDSVAPDSSAGDIPQFQDAQNNFFQAAFG